MSQAKHEKLLKQSLKSLMTFLKEFQLCPHYLHLRACQLIWLSVIETKSPFELTNNPNLKSVLNKSTEMGSAFTLSYFVAFLFKFAIIHFNYINDNPQDFNTNKKILKFLQYLEISDAFREFLRKLNRTYSA